MASTSTNTSGVSFTGRLAGFTARHGWWTLGAWVVVLVAAFLLAGQMNLTGDSGIESSDSARAKDLIEEAKKQQPNKTMLGISANGLKQAAETVADVAPKVLQVATQIADFFARFGGG